MSDVEIRKYEVTRTAPNSFVNKYVDTCRNCDGEGLLTLESGVLMCTVCNGTGLVKITKVIDVIIKPFIQI